MLFDEEPLRQPVTPGDQDSPRTIADALLDASMSIDDPIGKKRRAALNSHRSRLNSRGNLSPMSADGERPLEDELIVSPTATSRSDSRDPSRRSSSGKAIAEPASPMPESPYSARRLRHQSSAMNLLNRKDSAKSGPETGTTETNAFGEVEGPFTPALAPRAYAESENDPLTRLRANHTYQGNDPSILKMLDSMYVDNYPHDIARVRPSRSAGYSPKSLQNSRPDSRGSMEADGKARGNLLRAYRRHQSDRRIAGSHVLPNCG